MAGRQSRGRQRIPMRRIESQDDLYASFSKRRCGLYKKASELSTLCGADVGIIIFSPTNNPFSFWHPTMESVIERYRNPLNKPLDDHTRIIEANTRDRIEYLNRRLDEVLDEKEEIKEQEKQLNEIDKTREKVWWEQTPIENLNNEQVKEWKAWFEDLNSKVKNHIEELRNIGASSSTAVQFQHQNAPFFPSGASPSTFPQNFPRYAPTMGMIEPSQFHGQYYNVPPQAPLPFAGDGTSHVPGQYYPPPRAQYHSAGGGGGGGGSDFLQFPGLFDNFPRQVQDPSTSGTGEPSTSRGVREPSTHARTREAAYPSRRRDTNP